MDDVLQVSIEDLVIINPGAIRPSTSHHQFFTASCYLQKHSNYDSYYLGYKQMLFVLLVYCRFLQ